MPWTSGVFAAFLHSLLFWGILGQKAVIQKPAALVVQEGESVNITCSVTNGRIAGMYLKRAVVNVMDVLYIRNDSPKHTISIDYKTRIESSIGSTDVKITLYLLQTNDTDLYVCQGSVLVNDEPYTVSGNGTMVVVVKGHSDSNTVTSPLAQNSTITHLSGVMLQCVSNEAAARPRPITAADMEQTECRMASWVPYSLSCLSLLLVFVLGFLILSHVNIKKYCQDGKKAQANIVYEDMSYSHRCSTLDTTHTSYKY